MKNFKIQSGVITISALLCGLFFLHRAHSRQLSAATNINFSSRVFTASGIIKEIQADAKTIVIKHGAISNYMAAMTMPFKVKTQTELASFQGGDEITFQLHVTENESWVDHLAKIGTAPLEEGKIAPSLQVNKTPAIHLGNPLLDYKFTNELGQAVSLNDFRGQALAITFFYTRCPLPDFCPRLSKNFQEASHKLKTLANAPANWHLISISFDTEFDSPAMLKAYGDSYNYDSSHWSFLTGPAEKIGALAQASGANYQFDDGTFNHNFRTLIVDPTGHLQMIFPTGGNLSDQIVAEIIKAAAVTNPIALEK